MTSIRASLPAIMRQSQLLLLVTSSLIGMTHAVLLPRNLQSVPVGSPLTRSRDGKIFSDYEADTPERGHFYEEPVKYDGKFVPGKKVDPLSVLNYYQDILLDQADDRPYTNRDTDPEGSASRLRDRQNLYSRENSRNMDHVSSSERTKNKVTSRNEYVKNAPRHSDSEDTITQDDVDLIINYEKILADNQEYLDPRFLKKSKYLNQFSALNKEKSHKDKQLRTKMPDVQSRVLQKGSNKSHKNKLNLVNDMYRQLAKQNPVPETVNTIREAYNNVYRYNMANILDEEVAHMIERPLTATKEAYFTKAGSQKLSEFPSQSGGFQKDTKPMYYESSKDLDETSEKSEVGGLEKGGLRSTYRSSEQRRNLERVDRNFAEQKSLMHDVLEVLESDAMLDEDSLVEEGTAGASRESEVTSLLDRIEEIVQSSISAPKVRHDSSQSTTKSPSTRDADQRITMRSPGRHSNKSLGISTTKTRRPNTSTPDTGSRAATSRTTATGSSTGSPRPPVTSSSLPSSTGRLQPARLLPVSRYFPNRPAESENGYNSEADSHGLLAYPNQLQNLPLKSNNPSRIREGTSEAELRWADWLTHPAREGPQEEVNRRLLRGRRALTQSEDAAVHAEHCHTRNLLSCGGPTQEKLKLEKTTKGRCQIREDFLTCMEQRRHEPCPPPPPAADGKKNPANDPVTVAKLASIRAALKKGLTRDCFIGYSTATSSAQANMAAPARLEKGSMMTEGSGMERRSMAFEEGSGMESGSGSTMTDDFIEMVAFEM